MTAHADLMGDFRRYLADFDAIWAEDGPGGARQAHKIERCLRVSEQLLKTDRQGAIGFVSNVLAARTWDTRPSPCFLPNLGGCGSHWIAAQIEGPSGLADAEEVYLPASERERLVGSDLSPSHAAGFADGIAAFHTLITRPAHQPRGLRSVRPLNTAHGVTAMRMHDRLHDGARFCHIDRDPRDRTLSVAFRKAEYRRSTAAEQEDRDFLLATARRGHSHYRALWGMVPDLRGSYATLRYEDFKADPGTAIIAACDAFGLAVPTSLAQAAGGLFAAGSAAEGRIPGKSNYSGEKRAGGWRAHEDESDLRLIHGVLIGTIETIGYAPCDCAGRRARAEPVRSEPMTDAPGGARVRIDTYADGRRLRLIDAQTMTPDELAAMLASVGADTVCAHGAELTGEHLRALCAAPMDVLDLSEAVLDAEAGGDDPVRAGTVIASGLSVRTAKRKGRDAAATLDWLRGASGALIHDFARFGPLPLPLGEPGAGPVPDPALVSAQATAAAPLPAAAADPRRDLSAELTFGQGFYPRADDEAVGSALMDGRAKFRGGFVALDGYQAPPEVDASLRQAWLFSYHSLGFLDVARRRYLETGDEAYKDRYLALIDHWLDRHGAPLAEIPTAKAPGDFAWYDMAVAWRTLCLVAALQVAGEPDRLIAAIQTHADFLADPRAYAGVGNHALHQDDALLTAALILDRPDLAALAIGRIQALREASIDDEGVVLEGSVAYHFFNAFWWGETARRLAVAREAGMEARIALPDMRPFMTWSLAPDAKLALIGDTAATNSPARRMLRDKFNDAYMDHLEADPQLAHALDPSVGAPPEETARVFADGFAFSRFWADGPSAGMASLRFGPGLAERVHAHDDAGAVTYYRGRARILEDGGLYGYYGGPAREFVKSNAAHNTLVRTGAKYFRSAVATLERRAHAAEAEAGAGAGADLFQVRCPTVEGMTWHRTLVHLRALPGLVVQDSWRTVRDGGAVSQLLNLGDGFRLASLSAGKAVITDGAHHGAVMWLEAPERLEALCGEPGYAAGWRSSFEGEIHPVTTLRATLGGEAPSAGKATFVLVMTDTVEDALAARIDGYQYASDGASLGVIAGGAKTAMRWTLNDAAQTLAVTHADAPGTA